MYKRKAAFFVLLVVSLIFIFGFLLPHLISSSSNELVLLGTLVQAFIVYLSLVLGYKIFSKKEKK